MSFDKEMSKLRQEKYELDLLLEDDRDIDEVRIERERFRSAFADFLEENENVNLTYDEMFEVIEEY